MSVKLFGNSRHARLINQKSPKPKKAKTKRTALDRIISILLIVVTLQGSGSAQAAAVFCSPANISKLTAETVTGIAARYGVTGECAAYSWDALDALLEEKIQTEPGK